MVKSVTKQAGQMFIQLLPRDTMRAQTFVLPSDIERETGFGIGQLRKWRQRLGFPPAASMADGKAA